MTLLLRCKRCKHEMKYLPRNAGAIATASKRCVYCGASFKVKDAIIKRLQEPYKPRSGQKSF